MDAKGFFYSPLGAAIAAALLLFGALFYMYGTEGRYQRMEKQELLRLFFLPPAIVAASIYWFVSGRTPDEAGSVIEGAVPPPPPPAAVEFEPVPAPTTPILTEPFAD